jgi:hypothetical protein
VVEYSGVTVKYSVERAKEGVDRLVLIHRPWRIDISMLKLIWLNSAEWIDNGCSALFVTAKGKCVVGIFGAPSRKRSWRIQPHAGGRHQNNLILW